jgi:hypothetical protein
MWLSSVGLAFLIRQKFLSGRFEHTNMHWAIHLCKEVLFNFLEKVLTGSGSVGYANQERFVT